MIKDLERPITYRPDELLEYNGDFGTFESFLNFKSARSENALNRIQRESNITIRWANHVAISVLPLPNNLYWLATEYYGSAPDDIGLVAFVRHNYTSYEDLLSLCHNSIGHKEAYEVLKTRITKRICKELGIKFSLEYIYNTRLDWVKNKEEYKPMSMYG